jgi:hypothetical protein
MEKENLRDRMPAPGKTLFLDGEGASVKGFLDFCKRNTPLVIAVTLTALFVYGAILFNIIMAGDNQHILNNSANYIAEHIRVGRWASPPLLKLFFIKESGIFASNFISTLSIWLFSILFCYFIAVFTKNTERRNGLIPAALIVLTYAVWPEYFMFFYQNKIQTIFICVTLINVYILYDGFLSRNKIKLIVSFILTVFSFGVYQPLVPLFLCVVFVYFVLLQENSNYPAKEYSFLCLKLFVFFIAAFALNSGIGKIFLSLRDFQASDYVTKHMVWEKISIRAMIAGILGQGYIVTIGMIPFVHSLFSPIMISMYGDASAVFAPVTEMVFEYARTVGNVLLLPAGIAFLVMILLNAKKRLPKGRRILYFLAGLGIPCSILFIAAISGEVLGVRILYSLPFAAAFMFYYVASKQKTVLRRVFYCLILATAFYQAQVSQNTLELAIRTTDYDMTMAFDIDDRVRGVLGVGKKLPVAYIGKFDNPFRDQTMGILSGQIPVFNEWTPYYKDYLTNEVSAYMNILGFYYDLPTLEQIEEAYEASRDMPAYPLEGCVKNLGGVVVIKMGE